MRIVDVDYEENVEEKWNDCKDGLDGWFTRCIKGVVKDYYLKITFETAQSSNKTTATIAKAKNSSADLDHLFSLIASFLSFLPVVLFFIASRIRSLTHNSGKPNPNGPCRG